MTDGKRLPEWDCGGNDIRLGQQSDTDLVELIHYLDRVRQISLSSLKYRRYDTITLDLASVN